MAYSALFEFYKEYYKKEGAKGFAKLMFNGLAARYHESKIHWTPRKLFLNLKNIKIDRPIFLLGTQGGGLTFLSRIIRRHPQVVTCTGNNRYWTGRDEMQNVFFKYLPHNIRMGGLRNYNKIKVHPIFGQNRYGVYATDALINEYRQVEHDYNPSINEAFKKTIKWSIRAYAHDIKSARFLDKSQSYSLKVPLIKKCLKNPKFVLMLRNPYAMCWRAATASHENWNQKLSFKDHLRFSAQHWYNTFNTALSDLNKTEDMFVLRFEDLLQRPEKKVKEILDYLELDYHPYMLPHKGDRLPFGSADNFKWYPINPDINNKYLSNITPEAIRIIDRKVGSIAKKFDYSPKG